MRKSGRFYFACFYGVLADISVKYTNHAIHYWFNNSGIYVPIILIYLVPDVMFIQSLILISLKI